MNSTLTKIAITFIVLLGSLSFNSCKETSKEPTTSGESQKTQATLYPSQITPYFDDWKLILGNGTNAGNVTDYVNKDFFYTTKENGTDWVVYKTPNGGNTHGSSSNTRTELAQAKKWKATTPAKLTATLKVMNVSATGDARVAASYSVVVGQIHSADGHENEPFKLFYKKFPGHKKGSLFWNYEINTLGDDNSDRWDYSYPIWGYSFADVGSTKDDFPPEPSDGIELGEEFSYVVETKGDGIMHVSFSRAGHDTKTFTKNLIVSEYTKKADIPEQVKGLFVPIGQDGVEVPTAYEGQGLFFKQGCYSQTNGKPYDTNPIWCAGAETYGGDLQKQFDSGNYSEVWFKEASITVHSDAYSNAQYFANNDDYQKARPFDSTDEKK